MDYIVHLRNPEPKELLCGRKTVPGDELILEPSGLYDSNEITCPECHANIPPLTAKGLDAALPEVLDELFKERR